MEQKSKRERRYWAQFDALEMGTGWTSDDITKPQIMVESVWGDSHPGSYHLNQMTEQAMIFRTPDGELLNGVIDLIVRKGNAITVLDYKTHSGSSLDDGTLARYSKQVALYAHGLASLYPDCTIDTCLLVMYSDGKSALVRC